MISIATSTALFEKYNNLAANNADAVTDRNMHQLMMWALDSANVDFDGCDLILPQGGLWKQIDIEQICGAEDMGAFMAIILPACVLYVHKATGAVRVFLPQE